jgi:pimeloyl-ACP methyl ester carboxylesterase
MLRRPVLLLSGEHDGYSPEADLRELASALPNAEVAIVAGTDHYLWRREREAASIVGAFAERLPAD